MPAGLNTPGRQTTKERSARLRRAVSFAKQPLVRLGVETKRSEVNVQSDHEEVSLNPTGEDSLPAVTRRGAWGAHYPLTYGLKATPL